VPKTIVSDLLLFKAKLLCCDKANSAVIEDNSRHDSSVERLTVKSAVDTEIYNFVYWTNSRHALHSLSGLLSLDSGARLSLLCPCQGSSDIVVADRACEWERKIERSGPKIW